MQRQFGSSKHSPAFPCLSALSVSIRVIRGYFALPSKRLDHPLIHLEPGTPAQVFAQWFTIHIQLRGQLAQGTKAREAPSAFPEYELGGGLMRLNKSLTLAAFHNAQPS